MDQKILKELQEIKKSLTNVVTKDDLKNELSNYPTKNDAKAFVTKDDLKNFATKNDLKTFATKDDLKGFGKSLVDDISEVVTALFIKTDNLKADTKDVERLTTRFDKTEQKLIH